MEEERREANERTSASKLLGISLEGLLKGVNLGIGAMLIYLMMYALDRGFSGYELRSYRNYDKTRFEKGYVPLGSDLEIGAEVYDSNANGQWETYIRINERIYHLKQDENGNPIIVSHQKETEKNPERKEF